MTTEEENSAVPPAVPVELSAEELAKMTKEERKAYHETRRKALAASPTPKAKPAQLTKAQRRMIQEAQRKAKEDKNQAGAEHEELLKDLKLQGLSEEQARAVILEMEKNDLSVEDADDDDDAEPEDFAASVRKWMAEQDREKVQKEALRDFNMSVRFQGHVDSTPPDHLACILQILVEEACSGIDLQASKLALKDVASKVDPAMQRWAPFLKALYGKIDDDLEAAQTAVGAVIQGILALGAPDVGGVGATILVGCLMAIREIELIDDEDLLASCRPIEPKSTVLDKYIAFLEAELEDEDDEDGEAAD